LLRAGVRIFEYSPGFLHAKSFVCDDEVAVVGTINLDYRSLVDANVRTLTGYSNTYS
jgi:cardiolipin synthase